MKELEIYFPMTCNVLTPGHIRCLEQLNKKGWVTIGLLTSKALKGYKEERQSYEDREYVLETIAMALGGIEVVPQDSLDPSENLKNYKCNAIASGDGFEDEELKAIKRLKIQIIEVRLPGEKIKKYSSRNI